MTFKIQIEGTKDMSETIQISRYPTEAQIMAWAMSALRNAPDGTVTTGLLEALVADFKDGLDRLKEPHPMNGKK